MHMVECGRLLCAAVVDDWPSRVRRMRKVTNYEKTYPFFLRFSYGCCCVSSSFVRFVCLKLVATVNQQTKNISTKHFSTSLGWYGFGRIFFFFLCQFICEMLVSSSRDQEYMYEYNETEVHYLTSAQPAANSDQLRMATQRGRIYICVYIICSPFSKCNNFKLSTVFS